MKILSTKARYFWPFLLMLFVTDCSTKDLVVEHLSGEGVPYPVVDSFVRFTLHHNPGTAFGFDIGDYVGAWARPILIGGMSLILIALLRIYYQAAPRARLTAIAVGLAAGGALGNIYDRIRFQAGVVDFIDVGVGMHRFYIFNVADVGVGVGALLLALSMLREEPRTANVYT